MAAHEQFERTFIGERRSYAAFILAALDDAAPEAVQIVANDCISVEQDLFEAIILVDYFLENDVFASALDRNDRAFNNGRLNAVHRFDAFDDRALYVSEKSKKNLFDKIHPVVEKPVECLAGYAGFFSNVGHGRALGAEFFEASNPSVDHIESRIVRLVRCHRKIDAAGVQAVFLICKSKETEGRHDDLSVGCCVSMKPQYAKFVTHQLTLRTKSIPCVKCLVRREVRKGSHTEEASMKMLKDRAVGKAHEKPTITKFGTAVAIAALLQATSPATAQEVQEPGSDEARMDVVIVSVTKRDASIQDIAASVSQLGGEDLKDRGVADIEDIALQIPNVNFGRLGPNSYVSIRGIGTTVDTGVAEPSVATYVDGVFLPRATMAILHQVDLERVEVVRGPQGTLYGRNATGGAINYVSQAPTDTFEGQIVGTLEERNGRGVDAYISGPLSNTVSGRLSGSVHKQDGYVKVINTGDDLADRDEWNVRGALKFDFSKDFTLDLSAQHHQSNGRTSFQNLSSDPLPVIGAASLFGITPNYSLADNETIANLTGEDPHSSDVETTLVSAIANWDISDDISFRSTTGYADHSSVSGYNGDGTDFLFVNIVDGARVSESFSQEFNLYGTSGKLDWLVGAFYFQESYLVDIPLDFAGFIFGSPDPVVRLTVGSVEEETESYALFTDVTYSVTDRFRINAGLRYNVEDKQFDFFGAPSPAGDLDTEDLLPKIGFQYDLTDAVNVYANWQQGIKSGGHQLGAPQLFGGEELTAIEVGLKSQWLDGRLTANTAIFSYDYTDLQATVTVPPTSSQVENGDAELFGFEGELYFAATDNIDLNLGVSLLDSEYTSLFTADQTLPGAPQVDLSGEQLMRAPEFTANLGGQWTIPINSNLFGDLTLRGDVYRSSSYKLNLIDYDLNRQEAYTKVNVSAAITDPSGNYQLRAFVNNLTDELTLHTATYNGTFGAFTRALTAPRTAGVSLSARF